MKFDYQTKLVKIESKLIPFYKYNNHIGFIPADIHFVLRGKTYNTSNMMTLLAALHKNKLLGNFTPNFTISNWYTNNKLNKNLFVCFTKELDGFFKNRTSLVN